MKISTNYMPAHKVWSAVASDHIGPIGHASFGMTENDAVFQLGIQYALHPERFARPLEEILLEGEV